MPCIFLTEYDFICWNLPIDSEAIVHDGNSTICLWMVELITLILKNCCLAQNSKTMGKALGNEKLTVIILCQLNSYMLAISRRAFTDIDCHIQNCALDTAN